MKKLIFMLVALLFIATSAMAATATVRSGAFVDQYKIDDPGGLYDSHLIYISHQVDEVVVQVSSINTHTFSESFICADGVTDFWDCAWEMPVLMELENIMIANAVVLGVPLTDIMEKNIYLAFWHEYKMKKLVTDAIAQMVVEEMNTLQQRRALKFIYFGHGIDIVTAQSIANDRITNSILPGWAAYNLATMPLQDRRLLKLFGEVGWFE